MLCARSDTLGQPLYLYLITMVIEFQGQQTLGSRSRIVEFKPVKNVGTEKV